ncbi:hypothetical protein TRFO_31336 [Tritrichomonas foetus]|uniref:Uncharacterized protein n=1 Tax=Tritrichomonas foetus TaxID=1144522 RepID=A0A1J4JW21_9EUKA|nr:hypothetical protein TRFO_31336 [Tritrichomonas foetus]|eukprot:OHT01726.1 hypothetical protein TRFO_31336 [Tritrichomonas foetus]
MGKFDSLYGQSFTNNEFLKNNLGTVMTASPRDNNLNFQLNRLPQINADKEMQLVYFLEKPIDSRENVYSPLFAADREKIPPIVMSKPPPKIVTMKGESVDELKKEWEKRFSRFHIHPNHNDYTCRSHSSMSYPTLAQRQIQPKNDPLNVLPIEDISNLRHHQVQGPTQQLSHLPKLRCLPAELQNQKRRNIKRRY